MASRFDDETVTDALDRAVRNAKHLRAKDAAAVALAKVLAERIDKSRNPDQDAPFDNVSAPILQKSLQQLGLVPDPPDKRPAKAPVETAPQVSELDRFRKSHQAG